MENTGTKTFTALIALSRGQRVKFDGSGNSVVTETGVGETGIGVVTHGASIGLNVAVGLDNRSREVSLAGTAVYGDLLYAAANGQVDTNVNGTSVGISLGSDTDATDFEMMATP